MVKEPTISVIIPVYNAQKTIERCIESLLSSRYHNLEIICVDDGSTDESLILCKRYEEKDDRVTVIHTENRGVAAARNTGIDMALGDYITFLDSDDYISPDIMKYCASIISSFKPDLMNYGHKAVVNGIAFESERNGIEKDVLHNRWYILENIVPVMVNIDPRMEYHIGNYSCTKLYNNDILKQYGIRFDESRRKWEDKLFTVSFLRYAQTYVELSKSGYYYVIHTGSLSGTFTERMLVQMIEGQEKYMQYFGDKLDFFGEYSVFHFCELFCSVACEQWRFKRTVGEKVLCIMVERALKNSLLREYFVRFQPKTPYQKRVRRCILERNVSQLCAELKREYNAQSMLTKIKTMGGFVERIKNGIIRRIRTRFDKWG